ncbi:hypothetical protein C9374_011414 [Naegleria lovaniensis]|uniref:Archaemetzincin-2 n=1 Tax=Naegleria lovaniensis TaxID=51637 RepID=A0AA88H2Y6_NAELO|nr:uncharacterized protein C9374_011414 [Naegleria lovaniensis]KAG2392689.1 hypothetical protein C9374_011414 [Naegleria lovaniensis]
MTSFIPPVKSLREKAFEINTVEPNKAAIYTDDDFDPMTKPKRNSWLAEHKEYGQSFNAYKNTSFNRIKKSKQNVIYICPLEQFSEENPTKCPSLTVLIKFLQAFYSGVEVKVLNSTSTSSKPQFTSRMNDSVLQYKTGDILNYLKKIIPKDAYCVLGLTMVDLYPDDSWNFVFGIASLENRVGVFSFARYHPSFYGDHNLSSFEIEKLLLRRSCKVASHEIGHMFGIKHCIFYQCAMNGSNHMDESDSRPIELCPVDLRKLQYCIGFDELERYNNMLNFFKEHADIFPDQISWFEKRLEKIRARKQQQ